jgi:hypothetical protein
MVGSAAFKYWLTAEQACASGKVEDCMMPPQRKHELPRARRIQVSNEG